MRVAFRMRANKFSHTQYSLIFLLCMPLSSRHCATELHASPKKRKEKIVSVQYSFHSSSTFHCIHTLNGDASGLASGYGRIVYITLEHFVISSSPGDTPSFGSKIENEKDLAYAMFSVPLCKLIILRSLSQTVWHTDKIDYCRRTM